MPNYNWPNSGVITHAFWQESQNYGPYIKMEIEVEPFYFGCNTISKLYKGFSLVLPTPPGFPTPIEQLEAAIGTELTWGPEFTVHIGGSIPALIGRRIYFRLDTVSFQGVRRIRIDKLLPKEKIEGGKILVKELREVEPGTMFQRPNGTVRYIRSGLGRKKPLRATDIFCFCFDGKSDGYWMSEKTLVKPCDVSNLTGIQIVEEEAEDGYMMCHVRGEQFPRIKHDTEADARNEAERLARLSGKRVYLLEAVAYVDYTPPGSAETQWVELDC